MIDSEARKEILSYTIQALNDSLLIEKRNSQIKESIKNFGNTIKTTQMDLDLCRSKMNELNNKKTLIQNKREQIADIQRNIIKILDNDNIIPDLPSNPSDYVGIPPVLMFILDTLYTATETQLSSKTTKIPISQVLEISDSINEMYNKLVDSNIIAETEAESQERNELIAQNQQLFMDELIGSINTDDQDDKNNDNHDDFTADDNNVNANNDDYNDADNSNADATN